MKVEKERIREVVHAAIDELNAQQPNHPPVEKNGAAVLFGRGGSLDSVGLVHLVVGVEQGVADAFGAGISLASDKAMARQRSPFRTIDSLVEFIAELLEDQSAWAMNP